MAGMTTAFVLGGGGVLGAAEVGMLRALFEIEVTPDLVLGTSVGALNGAMVARDPTPAVIARLTDLWQDTNTARAVSDRPLRTVRRAVSTGTHLYSSAFLQQRLVEEFGETRFEDLPVRFQVCAASIERAAEHWFDSGRLVDGDHGQRRRPRAAAPGRGGRRALPRRRHRQLHPPGPRGRARGRPGLRAPGRPDRPAAVGAETAVGGRPRLLRDRPAPPLRPRAGRGPARGRGPRAARPRYVGVATTRCWPTGTSRG